MTDFNRRNFLGGLFGGAFLGGLSGACTKDIIELAKSSRPPDHAWIAKDPVPVWISAAFAKADLVWPVMYVMGHYGIQGFKNHKYWIMADQAQTVLLRQLGDHICSRNGAPPCTKNIETCVTCTDFKKPTPERIILAQDWLWDRTQRDWSDV